MEHAHATSYASGHIPIIQKGSFCSRRGLGYDAIRVLPRGVRKLEDIRDAIYGDVRLHFQKKNWPGKRSLCVQTRSSLAVLFSCAQIFH